MKKNVLKMSLMAILVSASAMANQVPNADSEITNNLQVLAEVDPDCLVSNATLDFTNYYPIRGQVQDSETDISVTCTASTGFIIGLDLGQNADGTTRRMINADDPSQLLTYELYTDPGRGINDIWGENGNGLHDTGTGSAVNYTVYGEIPANQTTVTPGSYSDNVIISVDFPISRLA